LVASGPSTETPFEGVPAMRLAPSIVLTLAVAGLSLGAYQASASRSAAPQYVVHETWHASQPRDAERPAAVYAFQSTLAPADGGAVEGYAVTRHAPMVAWHATAQLPDGTVTVEGVLDLTSAAAARLPIVGGTGAYVGAQGVVVLRPDANGVDDDVTLQLTH